jgi:hypothetical protein
MEEVSNRMRPPGRYARDTALNSKRSMRLMASLVENYFVEA